MEHPGTHWIPFQKCLLVQQTEQPTSDLQKKLREVIIFGGFQLEFVSA
jgi:hypothetical protein